MADAKQTSVAEEQPEELTKEQRAQLEDQELQARHQAAFQQQMRRMSCPGCGETGAM